MTYRCRECNSDKVQGSLPAWFNANDVDAGVVDVDYDAEFKFGWCPDCESSGHFSEVAEDYDDEEEGDDAMT